MPPEKPLRFDLLDGLRGLAAISVVFYHFTQHNGLRWMSGAWVAVDLFFILSGFVIAHSYGPKLLAGMPLRRFLLVRFIRLGPLYFVGLLLGVVAAAVALAAGELGNITWTQLATAAVLGAMWLPYLNDLAWPFGAETIGGPVFPLNDPSWSLFLEVFVNAVFFFFVFRFRRLSSHWLFGFAAISYLLVTILFRQVNPGWGYENFVFGFPRVIAEFFAGVLIYQLGFHERAALPRLTLLALGGAASLVLTSGLKTALVNSVTLVPLSVALASAIRIDSPLWKRVCKVLGDLSYPLYIVHYPLYRLLWQVPPIRAMTPVSQTVLVGLVSIGVALVLAVLDERVRRRLMGRSATRWGAVNVRSVGR